MNENGETVMTNEELLKLNKKLDDLDLKLDVILKGRKQSFIVKALKALGILFFFVLITHVLVIGVVAVYSLMKESPKTETETPGNP